MGIRVYLGLCKIERTGGFQFCSFNNLIDVLYGKITGFRTLSPVFEKHSMSATDILGMLDRFILVREKCKEELAIRKEQLEIIDDAIAVILGGL